MVTLVTIVIDSCTRYNQGKYKTPTLDLGNWDQPKKKEKKCLIGSTFSCISTPKFYPKNI